MSEGGVVVTGNFEEVTEIGLLVSPEDIAMFAVNGAVVGCVKVVDVSTDEKVVGRNGSVDVPEV